MTNVSPSEYKSAQHSIENIKPVLIALQKVDAETLKGDIEAISSLQSFKRTLTKINNEHQAVLDEGLRQYSNRPIELINNAASRLNAIPRDIELEQKTFAARLDIRRQKAEELSKRFSEAEIEKIVPPIPKSEADASAAIIAWLKAEAEAIKEFLADSPRYSIDLLKNTQLYPVAREEIA